jgi:hypothetical protein
VVDPSYGVVYIPYAKGFSGMATETGVLTCTPNPKGLACVDMIERFSMLLCPSDGTTEFSLCQVGKQAVGAKK